jgi:UDP-glucuronate 4-epimerase
VRRIVHLAAQAGVRYSIDNPFAYEHANLRGHLSVLEACRHAEGFRHLVYASSSSVYGERPLGAQGFSEDDPVDAPVSLYAATKRAGELMSGTYARLYGVPQSGLRFFTVYGPWGRPDMAYYGFTRKILAGEPIEVFGDGEMTRDFTYIDDVVDGVVKVLLYPPAERPTPPVRIFNLGHHRPVETLLFVRMLEQLLGRTAQTELLPPQAGDMIETCADLTRVHAAIGFAPMVPLEDGLRHFVEWFRGYYGL